MPIEAGNAVKPGPSRLVVGLRAACLALAALIAVSHFAFGATPKAVNFVPAPWDLLLHALLFGTIAFLANVGLGGGRPMAVFALACLIGSADEALQLFEPGRHADWSDLLADMLGALVGAFSARALLDHAPAG
ncbi:MAG: VanZ family protein [Rhodocyclaceae bacterium]|nr:VanZ family protein [Rhodocyclaceae bacterium]